MEEKKVIFNALINGRLTDEMRGRWVDTTVGTDNSVKAIIIDDHGGVQAVDLNHIIVVP